MNMITQENLKRVATFCSLSYNMGLNPLPILRKKWGGEVEFLYSIKSETSGFRPVDDKNTVVIWVDGYGIVEAHYWRNGEFQFEAESLNI